MKAIEIIYEDDDLLAVNKPAGLVVHGDGLNQDQTLADWFSLYCPEAEEVGEKIMGRNNQLISRPGIVHRLDKATSGVIILVKNQSAYLSLKEQFLNKTIIKKYHLLTYGRPPVKTEKALEIIDRPIGRHPKDPRRRSAGSGARGNLRPAITSFKIIEFFAIEKTSGYSFVEAQPQTGRMHQLRVHFKYLNHPIVGDELYAPNRPKIKGLDRLALHASSISFKLPTGGTINLETELPADFTEALENLRQS